MNKLTDEQLEKLGKVFVYHTYGLTDENPGTLPEPRLPFELFVESWIEGKDLSKILPALQHYQHKSPKYTKLLALPRNREQHKQMKTKKETIG
ncbi:hypothetical protein ACGTN9_06920 [Halobacillus sp. MO56]